MTFNGRVISGGPRAILVFLTPRGSSVSRPPCLSTPRTVGGFSYCLVMVREGRLGRKLLQTALCRFRRMLLMLPGLIYLPSATTFRSSHVHMALLLVRLANWSRKRPVASRAYWRHHSGVVGHRNGHVHIASERPGNPRQLGRLHHPQARHHRSRDERADRVVRHHRCPQARHLRRNRAKLLKYRVMVRGPLCGLGLRSLPG